MLRYEGDVGESESVLVRPATNRDVGEPSSKEASTEY